ncbi:MAG: endonuclease domain-containing protein [Bacteroidetes bacterium]|nr:endonuclease domain-containing protein [Bacteroidota bacterium]
MKKPAFKRRIIPYNQELKELARRLRNNSTLGEILLWKQLRNYQIYGYDFHRQKPLLNYIVDFYCAELKLVIEVDGQSHDHETVYLKDIKRQAELEEYDLHFIRFRETEIRQNIHGAIDVIENYIEEFEKHTPRPSQEGKSDPRAEKNNR